MNNSSGIYSITSPSGKLYIGSAVHFIRRRGIHLHALRHGKHHSSILQKAFDKYGEKEISFEQILFCEPKDLLFYEQLILDAFKPEYNICKVAGSSLGLKRSAETKQKLSKFRTGSVMSEDVRIKIRATNGSAEARLRNSEQQKAIHSTAERRKANSEQQKISQNRPEVRAKKGRALMCVENGLCFTNGHAAAEWCHLATLTTNKNAFVAINSAVRSGKAIYGYHWKAI